MTNDIWILGGSGRTGRAIATKLADRGLPVVLVGRSEERLRAVAGHLPVLALPSVAAMASEIARLRPAVVVNTIGPFVETTRPIVQACLGGSAYVDLANDLAAVLEVIGMHDAAVAAGRTFVTGAGFGVTATESVVTRLCHGRPPASRVRVDMMPSLALEAGAFGDALAATILEGLPGVQGGGRFAGRRYAGGRLRRARIAGEARRVDLPDGGAVTTSLMPLGELVAAQRASGASAVVSASSELPSAALIRALLPLLLPLLGIAPLRRFARRRLAAVQLSAGARPRPHSWAHARVEWPDGTARDGWLRLDDASDFTAAVCAEVAARLHAGEAPAGASTPAATFGTGLAESCGATYLIDEES